MIQSLQYSIDVIQDEARRLVDRGILGRHQPIYALCQHIPAREWSLVESELERYNYLLREPLVDLLGKECWDND
jgi:uncharacterized protein YqgQ